MEETDVCYLTRSAWAVQQAIPNGCAAKAMLGGRRQRLAVQAMAGTRTITALAAETHVSRKFVHRQISIANQALDEAFEKPRPDDEVWFYFPVTKQWLEQLCLALILICHSSLRGVVELLRDLFDTQISLGTVYNIVHAAVELARKNNNAQDLRQVRVGAHDEIYQCKQPVLVGMDALSSYCYLLSSEDHCDGDTWGVRLLELQERGFQPDYVVADAGKALRMAQAEILPQVRCRSDVFHTLKEVQEVVTILENRAYDSMVACVRPEQQIAQYKRQGRPIPPRLVADLRLCRNQQAQAIALADDIALLKRWLHYDVLNLAGPSHADRLALYDFILHELNQRIPQAAQLLGRITAYLKGQRADLLAFAAQLDQEFDDLAARFAVAPALVRELFAVEPLPLWSSKRWRRDALLRRSLGPSYFALSQALDAVRRRTVRASSCVENLNSRLRNYFTLRRRLGNGYLALLQFFLNHRRFLRSKLPERVNKSPTELLTGKSHSHWLELLGYSRFLRN
jgi:hypothetical protein